MESPFKKKSADVSEKVDDLVNNKKVPYYEPEKKEEVEEEIKPKEEVKPKTRIKINRGEVKRKTMEAINHKDKPPRKLKEKHKKKIRVKKVGFDWNRGLLYLVVFGILIIIFFSQELDTINPVMTWIMVIFGMIAFMPMGLILGKLFLDPYVRCKIARRMGNRNYGLVHLIHKGGKKIEMRIKNLTDDVIIQGTKLWVLEDGGIYYSDRNDALIFHTEITSESFVTSPNNVPMLFLDAETMLPLRFHKPETKWLSNPQQVGATVLGYINNQIAKNLFFKRSMNMFYIIILVLQVLNFVGLIVLYDELVGI
jgi:hypothetical protein